MISYRMPRIPGDEDRPCPDCGFIPQKYCAQSCDLCMKVWCRTRFPFGGTYAGLEAHRYWKDRPRSFDDTVGARQLFCPSCYEELNRCLG